VRIGWFSRVGCRAVSGQSKPAAPAGLGVRGRRLWRAVVGGYELRPDELMTLEDVAHLSDMIVRLSEAWLSLGCPLTTKGSMGQQVTHPLISEIRAHRMSRNTLLRQLGLPDVDGELSPSMRGRALARARWAR
jgi:hypothetical protein